MSKAASRRIYRDEITASLVRREIDQHNKHGANKPHFTALADKIGVSARSIYRAYQGATGTTAQKILEHYGYKFPRRLAIDVRSTHEAKRIHIKHERYAGSPRLAITVREWDGSNLKIYHIKPADLVEMLEAHLEKQEEPA